MGSVETIFGAGAFLRRPLTEVSGVRKMPWLERRLLLRGSPLKGEELHLGPPQVWLARSWVLRLGSVKGTVHKVGLVADTAGPEDAGDLLATAITTLQTHLGPGQRLNDDMFVVDGDDGNAIVQRSNVLGDRRIMVALTSDIVRQFQRS